MKVRQLVISAVNFSEGGPLTILRESLESAVASLGPGWEITALVHNADLIDDPRIRTIAYPDSKKSWFKRIRLEWVEFRRVSRRLKPDLWLSLHDATPLVDARRQAVYCHNPSPFYRPRLIEIWFDPRFILFNKLYLFLYRAFIQRNSAVIVQQSWLRDAFERSTKHRNIVVAYPGSVGSAETAGREAGAPLMRRPTREEPLRLLYPALPRVFKNIETICEALALLPREVAELVELRLTVHGTENRWARELYRRYGALRGVRFIGRVPRDRMAAEYTDCDMVLFPSRLETWGLPISEAKSFGKPLLVADLPYAHETVGTYADVAFLPPNNPAAWAEAITEAVAGHWSPAGQVRGEPRAPFFNDWPSLWAYLTKGL